MRRVNTPDPLRPAARSGDAETAQLMRLTELAPEVPPHVHRAARMATAEVWRQVVTARRRQRRALAWVAIITFALLGWFSLQRHPAREIEAARVEAVRGLGTLDHSALRVGGAIGPGTRVETRLGGRAALRLTAGQSLRVDESSRFELLADGVILLERGAIYIDSGRSPASEGAHALEIRTSFGVARNLGTQFEVRLGAESLTVRVREGAVRVTHEEGTTEVRVGDELTISDGAIERRRVARFGDTWSWPLEVAPVFPLEGSSLGEYLDWLVRETGWAVHFEDSSLAAHATSIVLHGSLEGFAVAATLDLVLASCELSHEADDGTLILRRAR